MPNQYNKVELTVDFKIPSDTTLLEKQYTKALFELLKNKIPRNPRFIEELIDNLLKN